MDPKNIKCAPVAAGQLPRCALHLRVVRDLPQRRGLHHRAEHLREAGLLLLLAPSPDAAAASAASGSHGRAVTRRRIRHRCVAVCK